MIAYYAFAAVVVLIALGYQLSKIREELAGIRDELARMRKMVP